MATRTDNDILIDLIISALEGCKVASSKPIKDSFKYLLGQAVRQYQIQPENQHISRAAVDVWTEMMGPGLLEDLIKMGYKETFNCKNAVTIPTFAGATKKWSTLTYKNCNPKDKLVFNDLFIVEHTTPVSEILIALTDYYKDWCDKSKTDGNTLKENVKKILDKIHITRLLRTEDRRITNNSNRLSHLSGDDTKILSYIMKTSSNTIFDDLKAAYYTNLNPLPIGTISRSPNYSKIPASAKKTILEDNKYSIETMNKNETNLFDAFLLKKNILLVGENQYVDSSIISYLASQAGYKTIEVTDLGTATLSADGGVTISRRYDSQGKYTGKSFRDQWVKELEDEPNQRFVLVLNYADSVSVYDKENYLAWLRSILNHNICGDHIDNYIVVAKLYSQDNLDQQMRECFDDIIVWHISDEMWTEFFENLHKEYDNIYGKDLIDCLYKLIPYLTNPDDVREKLIKFIDGRAKKKCYRESSVENYIKACLKENSDNELSFDVKEYVGQLYYYIKHYLDEIGCNCK